MLQKLVGASWIILRRNVLIYTLMCAALFALMGAAMSGIGWGSTALAAAGILGAYFIINAMFEAGYKNNEMLLLLTMPYTRKDIISGRYAVFFVGMGVLHAALFAVAALLSAAGVYSLTQWLDGLCAALAGGLVLAAAMIPIFIKWGYVAGRNIQLAAIMAASVVWLLLMKSGVDMNGMPAPALLLIGALCVALSYVFAVKIMRKKQF